MVLTTHEQNKTLICPRCSTWFKRQPMTKLHDTRGVTLDVCKRCGGMWLDREEVIMINKKQHKKAKKVNTNGKRN